MCQTQAPAEIVLAQPAAVGEEGVDLRLEELGVEGLGDVVVGTFLQAVNHKLLGALGREEDDGEPGRLLVVLDASAELITLDTRHHDVGDNDVAFVMVEVVHGLLTVGHSDDMVALPEGHAHILPQVTVVVDEE